MTRPSSRSPSFQTTSGFSADDDPFSDSCCSGRVRRFRRVPERDDRVLLDFPVFPLGEEARGPRERVRADRNVPLRFRVPVRRVRLDDDRVREFDRALRRDRESDRSARLRGVFGTRSPFRRASESPIATAWRRLRTRRPLRPDRNVPLFIRRIADRTLRCDPLLYLRAIYFTSYSFILTITRSENNTRQKMRKNESDRRFLPFPLHPPPSLLMRRKRLADRPQSATEKLGMEKFAHSYQHPAAAVEKGVGPHAEHRHQRK